MQNGTALGSVSGSNDKTITRANLPDYNLPIGLRVNDGGYANATTNAFNTGLIVPGGQSETTDRGATYTAETGIVRSGGSGTAFDITPRSLSVNAFIYLGE